MAEGTPLIISKELFAANDKVSEYSEVAFKCSKCGTIFMLGSWRRYVLERQSGVNEEIVNITYEHVEACTPGAEIVFLIQNIQGEWLPVTY